MYRSGSNRAIILALAFMVTLSMFVAACGESVGETVDDSGITAQVKTALLNDPDVGGLRIDVDTSKGLVTLSGIVKSKAEADKAVAIARKVDGVRDVKSTLQVNPAS
ncbi:MAG TPA: BON domain-containing protein [Vicinamibacterales bacterium]|jgi:osmotically-inducible protein OsmY|nr:BON domain-containing protein [Vicinamibacterales bacterium]